MSEQSENKNRARVIGAGIVLGLGAGVVAAYLLARRRGIDMREKVSNLAKSATGLIDRAPRPVEAVQAAAAWTLERLASTNGTELARQSAPEATAPPVPPIAEAHRPDGTS